NKVNKTIYLKSLLGLLAIVTVSSCFNGFRNLEQENRGNLVQHLVHLQSNAIRVIQHGFITLAIKFLHFFVSRCLQFRYLPPLLPATSTISMLFWVAFTRAISSMSNDSL
ncbi:hypothetical protein CIPAW_08G056400, partial [Carya illinoinensis]